MEWHTHKVWVVARRQSVFWLYLHCTVSFTFCKLKRTIVLGGILFHPCRQTSAPLLQRILLLSVICFPCVKPGSILPAGTLVPPWHSPGLLREGWVKFGQIGSNRTQTLEPPQALSACGRGMKRLRTLRLCVMTPCNRGLAVLEGFTRNLTTTFLLSLLNTAQSGFLCSDLNTQIQHTALPSAHRCSVRFYSSS